VEVGGDSAITGLLFLKVATLQPKDGFVAIEFIDAESALGDPTMLGNAERAQSQLSRCRAIREQPVRSAEARSAVGCDQRLDSLAPAA
jgi:hypothetical protein